MAFWSLVAAPEVAFWSEVAAPEVLVDGVDCEVLEAAFWSGVVLVAVEELVGAPGSIHREVPGESRGRGTVAGAGRCVCSARLARHPGPAPAT